MTDLKLLELAAKADGRKTERIAGKLWIEKCTTEWNPLTDDGDALRLAVKLNLSFEPVESTAWVWFSDEEYPIEERYSGDPYAATRRAIVRAAAEIGKTLE